MTDPKEKFLEAAIKHFSEKGFYGASLAAVTADVGVTKQALLHHFGPQETRYGDVLYRIARRFEQVVETARAAADTAEERLVVVCRILFADSVNYPAETLLLTRELLDNRRRVEKARQWYLKPFLEELVALAGQTRRWQKSSKAEILTGVYQLLGAINYFAISEPTLTRMFGTSEFTDLRCVFPDQLEQTVRACLAFRDNTT